MQATADIYVQGKFLFEERIAKKNDPTQFDQLTDGAKTLASIIRVTGMLPANYFDDSEHIADCFELAIGGFLGDGLEKYILYNYSPAETREDVTRRVIEEICKE